MRVDSTLQDAAIQAVSRAAQSTGVDFGMLLETAKRESGLDRNAKAATSSAAGLFQFIESTWMGLIERYGGKYGVSAGADRRHVLDLRYDPQMAANMAGELTRENSAALTARLGRAPISSSMTFSLPQLLEYAWASARPGRQCAERNEVLRAFQPCPLSGKPDIEPTSPHDRVV